MDCSSVSNLKRYYVYSIKSIHLSPKANCTLRKEKKYILEYDLISFYSLARATIMSEIRI